MAETLKEHALRLIKEIQECPEMMGGHCIEVLCDELEPLLRIADITAPPESPRVPGEQDDHVRYSNQSGGAYANKRAVVASEIEKLSSPHIEGEQPNDMEGKQQ